MATYSPPEGYTFDETSGKYYSSVTGADPETGAPVQCVTWFDANTGEYTQHMYPAEPQTVTQAPLPPPPPQYATPPQYAPPPQKEYAILSVMGMLKGAFAFLMKKPILLWGISLMFTLVSMLICLLLRLLPVLLSSSCVWCCLSGAIDDKSYCSQKVNMLHLSVKILHKAINKMLRHTHTLGNMVIFTHFRPPLRRLQRLRAYDTVNALMRCGNCSLTSN